MSIKGFRPVSVSVPFFILHTVDFVDVKYICLIHIVLLICLPSQAVLGERNIRYIFAGGWINTL